MQSKAELENWYDKADPWDYLTTPDDQFRKERILAQLSEKYGRCLDIGAGEGFITKDLPGDEIHAIEISDKAAARFPANVKRVHQPEGNYDLIIATGVFYGQHDWEQMHEWIRGHALGTVVTCNIKDWEIPLTGLRQVYEEEFPYRQYIQKLRVYEAFT